MAVGWFVLRRAGMPAPVRAVPWVSSMVYGVVLAAGLYYRAMGLSASSGARIAGFVAAIALLFALEVVQQQRLGPGARRWPVITLLVARLGLFVTVAALDPSGQARVLFVLVPFAAYFAFGRAVSLALAGLCLILLLASYAVWVPHWYTEATRISDVLMFGVGLILAIAMASIAVGEQAGRAQLREALTGLEESHDQLTAYAAQVAELSAAAERNRLARDIHDSLGHHLTVIAVQLEKAAAFRHRDQAAADQALASARSSVRQALSDVRLSVGALRAGQPRFQLAPMLADLVQDASDGQRQVTLSVTGDESGISAAARTVLYRAAQEALTNARRHSRARRVSVSVTFGEHGARLVVADDGRGFSPSSLQARPDGGGFGLLGMRERAALIGGRTEVASRPGGGTQVVVTVPVPGPGGPADSALPAEMSG